MARWAQGIYEIVNKEKYKGNKAPKYRSSWEREFMINMDHNPNVLEWISEPTDFGSGRGGIPYRDPLTGLQKIYIPDFLITVKTARGDIVQKLIEIKPLHEALAEHARNTKDAAIRARNEAKWGAAMAWCMRRGIEFHVLSEADIFKGHENRKGRTYPIHAYAPTQPKKLTPKKPKVSKALKNNLAKTKKPASRKIIVPSKVAKIKKVKR